MPKKLTQQEAIADLEALNTHYDFSKFNYAGSNIKSTVICDRGHTYQASYIKLKLGRRCPYCSECNRWSNSEAVANLKAWCPDYDFSKFNYINNHTPGIVTCNKGHTYKVRYNDFKKGSRCPYCAGLDNKTKDIVLSDLNALCTGYDFSEFNFVNIRTKGKVTCNNGHTFTANYTSLMHGHGCPHCIEPKGERAVSKWLKNKGFTFEQQKRFRGLGKCSYDFYVPCKNLLIEFNGEQHYGVVPHFASPGGHDYTGLMQLRIQFERDMRKERYAKEHDYRLLVIPYWNFKSINNILTEVLL